MTSLRSLPASTPLRRLILDSARQIHSWNRLSAALSHIIATLWVCDFRMILGLLMTHEARPLHVLTQMCHKIFDRNPFDQFQIFRCYIETSPQFMNTEKWFKFDANLCATYPAQHGISFARSGCSNQLRRLMLNE